MCTILLFSIGDKLYFHSESFLNEGTVQVIGKTGIKLREFHFSNCVFGAYKIDIEKSKYLVRLTTEGHKIEKHLFIGKEN